MAHFHICSNSTGVLERRREAEHQLQDYVECEARDLSGEPFTRFMNQIYKRIYALISRCAVLHAPPYMVSNSHADPLRPTFKEFCMVSMHNVAEVCYLLV